MADENCWLVERNKGDRYPPEYLSMIGSYDAYAGRASGVFTWSSSPHEAIRFSRKEDGARVAAGISAMQDNLPYSTTLRGVRSGDDTPHVREHSFGMTREEAPDNA